MALTYSLPGTTGLTGTTDFRKALAGLIETDTSGNARAGVFPSNLNAIVTARSDMNVDIAAFQGAAVQFGGPILLTNDAVAQLPSVLVSPASGTNFYVVYAKQNENTSGGADGNTNRVLGTVLSTTSFALARTGGTRMDASGTGLPPGALEIATVQMPSGKTATNASGVTILQTFQYTATDGAAVYVRNSTELAAWAPADGSEAYQIDLGITHRRVAGAWKAWESDWITFTPASSTITVGAGTAVSRYRYDSGRVVASYVFTIGSGGNITGQAAVALPVTRAALRNDNEMSLIGGGVAYSGPASPTTTNFDFNVLASGSSVTVVVFGYASTTSAVTNGVTATAPFTPTAGSTYSAEFVYDPA